MTTKFLHNTPTGNAAAQFVFAHGAGAPMDSPFMNIVAEGLAHEGILVSRFEFPYMAMRRIDGKQRGPGNALKLLDDFRNVVSELSGKLPLFIGGKSMGGRIASMIADEPGLAGIICLGYPFHPPGKPEKLRTEHLESIKLPTLILQGTRDPFGTQEEVKNYKLSRKIKVNWIPDGEHSFKPRKSSGYTEEENIALIIRETAKFIKKEINIK
ncbi:MAG: alpha/beta family hydrolase [Pyrinomonadaceae bacterium]